MNCLSSCIRLTALAAVALCLLLAPGAASAQYTFTLPSGDSQIDQLVEDLRTNDKVVGVGLAVVYDGKIVYLRGYGEEDMEAGVAVDPRATRFRWASVSKTLTAALAVKAHQSGQVNLDTDIQWYYPSYTVPSKYIVSATSQLAIPKSDWRITMRQLLTHTSGIQHYSDSDLGIPSPTPPTSEINDKNINTGMEWALDEWIDNPLCFIPGEGWKYSTPAFNLAGVVLEKKMGKSFEALIQQHVATPAGMPTLRADTLWNPAPRRAKGYQWNGTAYVDDGDDDVSWKLAAGGFVSTVQDMGNYANALLQNQILTAAQMDMLWMPQELDDGTLINPSGPNDLQALSWFWDGDKVTHGGAQQKARCRLTLWPDKGLAVAIMTNAGHPIGDRQLSYDIGQLVIDRVDDGDAPIKDARFYMTAVSRLVYQTAPYLRAVTP